MTLDQSSHAIAVGLDCLRHLGIDWSPHPTEEQVRREYELIWSQLGTRTIEASIELPLMSDPASLATLDLLTKIAPPVYFTDANLITLVTCRGVNLSLERRQLRRFVHGVCELAWSLASSSVTTRLVFDSAGSATNWSNNAGLTRFQARTYMDFGDVVLRWTRHVQAGRDLLRRAFEAANSSGDLMAASCCYHMMITNFLTGGDPLVDVQRNGRGGLTFAQRVRFGLVIDLISAQLGLVRTLRGLTPNFGCFDDGQFDELRMERRFGDNPNLARAECSYWVRKLQARFFAGDYASAIEASSRAQPLLWTSPQSSKRRNITSTGRFPEPHPATPQRPDERRRHVEALTTHHRQLELWAANSPEISKPRRIGRRGDRPN